jgi:hypothetical protein
MATHFIPVSELLSQKSGKLALAQPRPVVLTPDSESPKTPLICSWEKRGAVTPDSWAYVSEIGNRSQSTDWLAVHAVRREPVSGQNSLINREITGNFGKFGGLFGLNTENFPSN